MHPQCGLTDADLISLAFIERHENVLALGAVGTGKTHLASALGIRACVEGKVARLPMPGPGQRIGGGPPARSPGPALTAALIDRLVHHAHILAFEGESYRLKRALSTMLPASKAGRPGNNPKILVAN